MKNKKHKIVLSTLLVLFNLVICFVATFAWFVGAEGDDASGMQFKMESQDLDLLYYKIFRYSDDKKCGIDVSDESDAFQLPYYDTVITAKNVHTPVIVLFCITGQELGSSTIQATLKCNNDASYSGSENKEYLSRIVHFKFLPISTDDIPAIANVDEDGNYIPTEAESSNIYETALGLLNSASVADINFVDEDDSSTTTYTVKAENYTVNDDGNLYLYMLFDYSSDLIDALINSLDDPTTLTIEGDLLTLMLSAIPAES